jgi:histidinol-phosphate aminotransferase
MTAANVWAANGSNEIQQQLLQAFGGRAHGAGLRAVVLDAPAAGAGTGTAWIGARRDPTSS